MWIPTSVYKRIPQFWFLLGLLYVAGGLYLGFDFSIAIFYFIIGLLCCLYGICVALTRTRKQGDSAAPGDATTED